MVALVKDGSWFGTFKIQELELDYFADDTLNDEKKILLKKVLKAKLNLEKSMERFDKFANSSKINLLRDGVKRYKNDILKNKTLLEKLSQLNETTKINLNSKVKLDLTKDVHWPIAENLSDITIWEILSIIKSYIFFEPRVQLLKASLKNQQAKLETLEKSLLANESEYKALEENFDRTKINHDFYHGKFKELKNQKSFLDSEVSRREFELNYSSNLVEKLEDQVKVAVASINEKTAKQTELNLELDICEAAYANLSSRIEKARIVKAMEWGEVKIISTAFASKIPISPNKSKNITISGCTSLMLDVCLAFFLESCGKNDIVKQC